MALSGSRLHPPTSRRGSLPAVHRWSELAWYAFPSAAAGHSMPPSIVEKYEQIFAADPRSRIFVELARALLERGNPERAIEVCMTGLEHHSSSIWDESSGDGPCSPWATCPARRTSSRSASPSIRRARTPTTSSGKPSTRGSCSAKPCRCWPVPRSCSLPTSACEPGSRRPGGGCRPPGPIRPLRQPRPPPLPLPARKRTARPPGRTRSSGLRRPARAFRRFHGRPPPILHRRARPRRRVMRPLRRPRRSALRRRPRPEPHPGDRCGARRRPEPHHRLRRPHRRPRPRARPGRSWFRRRCRCRRPRCTATRSPARSSP